MNKFTDYLSDNVEKFSVRKVITNGNVKYYNLQDDVKFPILITPYKKDMFFTDSFAKIQTISLNQGYQIDSNRHILITRDEILLKHKERKNMIIKYGIDEFISFYSVVGGVEYNYIGIRPEIQLITFFNDFLQG